MKAAAVDYARPGSLGEALELLGRDGIEARGYGMKGMGEGGAVAPPAAIANAVRDALAGIGAGINETPLTPRRVRDAIRVATGG